jgi:DNA-directed RNA polymerase subunit omega
MARITVEDCLKKVDNRFTLIHMTAKRVRQLRKGAEPTIVSKNKDIVVSLREIVAGSVVKVEGREQTHLAEAEAEASLLLETTEEKDDQKAATKEKKNEAAVAESD